MKKFKVLALLAMMVTMIGCSAETTEQTNNNQTNANNTDSTYNQYSLLSTDDPIEVTLWHYYAGSAQENLYAIVNDFNATVGAQQGVKVTMVSKPNIASLEVELNEAAQGVVYADAMPSMFLAYADKILELQGLGVISDMNEFFSDEDKEFLIEDFLESGIINGEQVMLPVVKSTEVIYINDTLWQEFATANGYTDEDLRTWEGLLEVSKAYYTYTDEQTPNVANDGKAFFGMDSLSNFISISNMQLGVDLYDAENGKSNIDEEVFRAFFDYYVEAYSMGHLDNIASYRTDDIRSGDLVSFVGSSAGFVYMPDWIEVDGEAMDIEWKSLPYPYYEEGSPYVVSQGAGIAVSKISDQQQQACALFLNFFWEDNIGFAIDSAYVPVTTEFLYSTEAEKKVIFEEYELKDNEIGVYELVLDQISNNELYQSMPFDGSYTLRTEITASFEQIAQNIRELVREKIASGVSRETVFEEIDLDLYFEMTMTNLYEVLSGKGVQ